MEKHCDFLIVGAGIIGSACARSICLRFPGAKIFVIDPDLDGEFSSSLKNAGGVRATWQGRANVELCARSIRFYEKIADIVSFKQSGYYWLHDEKTDRELREKLPLHRECGLDIEFYGAKDITKHLDFVTDTSGVESLSISRDAGFIDHYALREFYRKEARDGGAQFVDRSFARRIEVERGEVKTVWVTQMDDGEPPEDVLAGTPPSKERRETAYKCGALINTAGAWASRIASLYGMEENAVKPRRRQLQIVKCPRLDISKVGMVVDTSNVFFHGEGDGVVVGFSNLDEPFGVNYRYDFYSLDEQSPFARLIWKPLSKRIKAFENLKFIRGWAGMYGETADRSGFLGKAPGLENVYECFGHTGRGLMISYGAAEALACLIEKGGFDAEFASTEHLSRNRPEGPVFEDLHL
ncbi:NAD(P)/FAD-dependent oxidoreductase [Candidatus Mycalebacterium sp.]